MFVRTEKEVKKKADKRVNTTNIIHPFLRCLRSVMQIHVYCMQHVRFVVHDDEKMTVLQNVSREKIQRSLDQLIPPVSPT